MSSNELIFVTGATGFLGAQLVRELLDRHTDARLALLIRNGSAETALERAKRLLPAEAMARVQVYAGDVGRPKLGLSTEDHETLAGTLTRIIHCAATVRFDHTLEEARNINVEGTRSILDLAAATRHLRSFTYVGTAYVAGDRKGLIRESELNVGQAFRNTYEQTKSEAEALVQSRIGKIPTVILRPSIVVGDSRTGATSSFKMMYWPLKIYARRLWRTVPGYPDAVLDIVPVDYVARATVNLAFNPNALGQTVHLCAGPEGSATISQIAARARTFFNAPEPRYINPEFFFAAIRPLLFLTLWGKKRRVLTSGRSYRDYFSMRMQFDTTNAKRLLSPVGICPLPVLEYLDRLFQYCVETDWGRKAVSAE
jgi:thioester reductase-like protein